jgi:hypothetical protein
MMSDPLVQITISGASVAIINNSVYAAIISPPNATTWIATAGPSGTIVLTDQASGLVLSAPDTEPGTQAVAAPPGAGLPVTAWSLVEYSDDSGDDAAPVTDPGKITSGFYAIATPDGQSFLFRNRIEDRSLLPKVVALQPGGQGTYDLIIQVTGD